MVIVEAIGLVVAVALLVGLFVVLPVATFVKARPEWRRQRASPTGDPPINIVRVMLNTLAANDRKKRRRGSKRQ